MEQKFLDQSGERLSKIIQSKLRTTFIGDINTFEEEFKHLWADNEDMKKRWLSIRKTILDNGNNNIRALMKELRQYEIKWTGEKITFKVL